MMDRREFLHGLAMLGAVHAMPSLALTPETPPWAIGFEGVTGDLPPLPMQLRGSIPRACYGTIYRNGPALYSRAGQRYEHWFDPDGMVQAYQLGPDGVEHRGRFVNTAKYRQESAEGRFLYGGAGTRFSNQLPSRNNDSTNTANINVQPFNGELLALWEAGSAHRLDPDTLETKSSVAWSDELQGVPFSAHPRFDEKGDMWNIGSVPYARQPMLVLYHIGENGQLRKSKLHTLDFAGYMHDFVLTSRYLIALNSSAVMGEGDTFVDSLHWQAERPSQLLVFDREDFSLVKTIEVAPTFVFHFGNGWEENNVIHFTACQYPDMNIVSHGMRRLAQQQPGPYHDAPELVKYSVRLASGDSQVEQLGLAMEFPGFDGARPFSRQNLIGVSGHASSPSQLASAIVRVDPATGSVDRYNYGDGVIVEEPLLVPGQAESYIVHSFLDYAHKRSGLAVLQVSNLAAGPIALAHMPRTLPLGFHGCFMPA